MAYLLTNDTAQFVDKLKKSYSSVKKRRDLPLLNQSMSSDSIYICRITGGNAILGYTARAYETLAALRDDEAGTGGIEAVIFPIEIGLDGHLPVDSVVLCHAVACRVTGGTEVFAGQGG